MYFYPYPRPSLTVDAIVCYYDGMHHFILLIERGADPFKGSWALPGGFMDMDETLHDACVRELNEETGLKLENMTQLGVYDAIGRDPRGRTVSVVYYTFTDVFVEPVAADDASNAKWFRIDQLPDLAFDHALIMDDFMRKFRL